MARSVLDAPSEAPQVDAPKITVDPMMAEDAPSQGGGSVSFSDMTELPPLKEIYTPPPPPPAFDHASAHTPSVTTYEDELPEKAKIQPREIAQKAAKEIKNVPPSLMVYSIARAAVLFPVIPVILVLHRNTLNSEGAPPPPALAE